MKLRALNSGLLLGAFGAALLASCGKAEPEAGKSEIKDISDFALSPDLPLTTLVATHAIDLPEAAKAIGYIPNFNTPWTADVLILTEVGTAFSTEVEGRSFELVQGAERLKTLAGIPRENLPALFLATDQQGRLLAYQKGGDGLFKSIPISSPDLDYLAVCQPVNLDQGRAVAITSEGFVLINIAESADNKAVTATVNEIADMGDAPSGVTSCTGLDSKVGVLSAGSGFTVRTPGSQTAHDGQAMAILPQGTFGSITGVPLLTYSGDGEVEMRYKISDGFSVRGITVNKFMIGTTGSLGGPFSEGFVAMLDAESTRLVIMSLSYLKSEMELDVSSTP